MKRVLVLGNGISRLEFHDQIEAWDGEVWGCNYVYKDYGHKLTRLTGEVPKMWEGLKYRDEHGHKYEMWGGNLGRPPEGSYLWTCPRQFWNDSGTSSVAQALHEGYIVECVGFDLGGADCYYHTHYRKSKARWVERWAAIVRFYGSDRIRFWGYNHTPFIKRVISGQADPAEYQRIHRQGHAHIPTESYRKILEAQHILHHTDPEDVPPVVRDIREQRGMRPVPAVQYELVQQVRTKVMQTKLVDVRFENGYRAQLRKEVAERMEAKGELTIIKPKEARSRTETAPEISTPTAAEFASDVKEEKPKRTYRKRVKQDAPSYATPSEDDGE